MRFTLFNITIILVVAFTGINHVDAFTLSKRLPYQSTGHRKGSLLLHVSSNKDDGKDDGEKDKVVSKEMFLRDLLADPESVNITDRGEVSSSATVRRKKKNGSHYRTLDNRDSLPFLVKVSTPDPYTSNAKMKKDAKFNSLRHKNSNRNKIGNEGKRRTNLFGMNGTDSISSSIYTRDKDGEMHRIVGEFQLDKSTNCGDIIEIGDGTEYHVQKARCQYKYAGGKRFVMTKKILEVKEIKRLLVEKEVKNLFDKETDQGDETFGNDGLMLE